MLEKFPDYWKGAVKFDRVVYRPIVEDQARLTELLTGTLDLIVGVPPDFVAQLEGSPKATLLGRWARMSGTSASTTPRSRWTTSACARP